MFYIIKKKIHDYIYVWLLPSLNGSVLQGTATYSFFTPRFNTLIGWLLEDLVPTSTQMAFHFRHS